MTDAESGLRVPIPNSHVGPIQINSHGFRSPEIESKKPPGVVRIAFLGASTTFNAEVSSNEHTWPHQVWQMAQVMWQEATIEYVNAGVPGYGVATSKRNLEYRVAALRPDVIFIYHATNDLSGNSFVLAKQAGLVSQRTEKELSWGTRYSLLWYLIEKNLRVMSRQASASKIADKLKFDTEEITRPFRRKLVELVRSAKQHADAVVLLTFSTRLRAEQPPQEQIEAAVTSLYYMPYMSIDDLLGGFDAYNEVIRETAKSEGVALLDIANEIPGDAKHFNDSVHLTDAGSGVMAERVFSAFHRIPEIQSLMTGRGRDASDPADSANPSR